MGIKLIKVSSNVLLELKGAKTQNIYTNTNFFVKWLFWSRINSLVSELNRHKPTPGQRVLDFGCGEGAFLPTLSSYFNKADALDLDVTQAAALVEELKINNVDFYKDIANLGTEVYDYAFALDVLEHIKPLSETIPRLHKVLKANGLLLVTGPSENVFYRIGRKIFGFTKPEDHYYTVQEIAEMLVGNGFEVMVSRWVPIPLLGPLNPFKLLVCRKVANV